MTEKSGGLLVLLFFLLLLCLGPPARAQSTSAESTSAETLATESTSGLGAQLMEHYQTVGAAFWQAEELRNAQTPTPAQRKLLLTSPVPESHPAYRNYFQAAAAADSFLELADKNKAQNWMLNPVLYLGGISHFSLGNYPHAETLFSRLSPNYLRDYYINDRDPVNPEFSTPTKPGISKLLFYCKLKRLSKTPKDALAAFKSITTQAQSTLAAQAEYAQWLANRKSVHDRREFSELYFGGQPDQIRAGALPRTLELLEAAWDSLLPAAVEKNHLPLRDYLRTLAAPESTSLESTSIISLESTYAPKPSISLLASLKLLEIDAHVIRNYFAQAGRLLKAHDFDGARRYYRRIIEEYPDSEASRRAQAQFPQVTRLAIAHYKAEGKKHFRPADKIGVPQTKAREYFEKMLKEDPDSDYALYYHSYALGTENKPSQAIRQLRLFEEKHPESPLLPSAMYLHGFILAGQRPPDYDRAVAIMDRVAQEFPDSLEAPEALWHGAFYLAWRDQFAPGLERLQKLNARYPGSSRHKWTAAWIARFQEKIESGGRWP